MGIFLLAGMVAAFYPEDRCLSGEGVPREVQRESAILTEDEVEYLPPERTCTYRLDSGVKVRRTFNEGQGFFIAALVTPGAYCVWLLSRRMRNQTSAAG
jgi:hypothetical protein